ncbi:phosphoglycerate dehydrogenase [Selenomonas sp. TAMA-11512]|uniref:phosphoglycerate dehydrogenase n=1 Tax=Selenomonas sp. TAMA-11512 TaxID=3095337 RepID=UPI0030857879|nr:phosphoglycerate dehydrogenase [Selenomonas sp. TAMA-11512]
MKVLVADGIADKGVEILAEEFEVVEKPKLSHEELLDIIGDFDALLVRSASKVSADVIERAEKLQIIGRAGVGVDNIDVAKATEKGIIVINSPGGNTIAATEHTMAMMLSMARNIPVANESMQRGEWNRKAYVGVELRGKTLGVIGMGRIGSGVAKRALSFEMNVIGYDPFINEERARQMGIEIGTLDDVIEKSDFITVHMPLNKETKGMLNRSAMERMKDGVRLINCARGGIIDEVDLADMVKAGKVAGAAIDVFTEEPLAADHPLIGVPGVVLTPHLGASTVEAQIGVSVDVAEGVCAALKGEPVLTAVNMASVSRHVMEVIRPYLTLAEQLGATIASLADGAVKSLEVEYNGEISEVSTGMVTTGIIKGMLNPILEYNVNYVNAPSLAQDRHIKVREVKNAEAKDFATLITVRARTERGERKVAGTLFGTEGRIVSIDDFRIDVDPHDRIVICPHTNVPGIVGKVGTMLGAHNINISSMQLARTEQQGISLMVLTVDNDISSAVLKEMTDMDGIFGARLVNFDAV